MINRRGVASLYSPNKIKYMKKFRWSTIEDSSFEPIPTTLAEVLHKFGSEEVAVMLMDKYNGFIPACGVFAHIVSESEYNHKFRKTLHQRIVTAGYVLQTFSIYILEDEEYQMAKTMYSGFKNTTVLSIGIAKDIAKVEDLRRVITIPMKSIRTLLEGGSYKAHQVVGTLLRTFWIVRESEYETWRQWGENEECLKSSVQTVPGFNYHTIAVIKDKLADRLLKKKVKNQEISNQGAW